MNGSEVKSINTPLRKLTFDDWRDRASEKILNRSMSYVKRVDQLSHTEDHTLVAWVNGSQQYATSVRVDEHGDFEYFCTCPCRNAFLQVVHASMQIVVKRACNSQTLLNQHIFRDSRRGSVQKQCLGLDG
jgi:hypothetical protein